MLARVEHTTSVEVLAGPAAVAILADTEELGYLDLSTEELRASADSCRNSSQAERYIADLAPLAERG